MMPVLSLERQRDPARTPVPHERHRQRCAPERAGVGADCLEFRMILARFDDRKEMQEASTRFVAALGGKPLEVSSAPSEWLECGHHVKNAYRYGGETLCQRCKPSRKAAARREKYVSEKRDEYRAAYLPGAIESTRDKLARLEREAKARGVIV